MNSRSLVARFVVLGAAVAVVAVVVTGAVVGRLSRDNAVDEVRRVLDEQDSLVLELQEAASRLGSWEATSDVVDRLADDRGLRIVIRDNFGLTLADSELDRSREERTPIGALSGRVLDPGQNLFSEEPSEALIFDEALMETFDKAFNELVIDCLKDRGALVAIEVDDVGGFEFPIADDFDAEAECFDEAQHELAEDPEFAPLLALFDELESAVPFLEPALLYLGYSGADQLTGLGSGLSGEIIGVTLAMVFTASVAMWLVARRVLGPVHNLTHAVRRMEAGALDERVAVDGSDELAELGHAFNDMASSIEHAEEHRRRLTSDVAHELRTPLANVRGYVEAAQDGVVPTDDELLATLHEETAHLQNIVDDLQTLSLVDAGRLSFTLVDTPVGEVMSSVANAHRARAEAAGITLIAEPSGAVAVADPARLRQTLTNLVENAIRHTDSGGSVDIVASAEGGRVAISVSDTGEGMATDQTARIFERFYRSDESRNRDTGGSGLGLAIVERLVRGMGGEVSVTSKLGVGSTFTITVPEVPTS